MTAPTDLLAPDTLRELHLRAAAPSLVPLAAASRPPERVQSDRTAAPAHRGAPALRIPRPAAARGYQGLRTPNCA